MLTITEIMDFIREQFDGTQKQFFYRHDFYQEISNPDESYLGTLNLNFSNYPDDDADSDIYVEESEAFENKVIQYINSNWETSLKELNENGHYMANSDGDTISVHFNDTSLLSLSILRGSTNQNSSRVHLKHILELPYL